MSDEPLSTRSPELLQRDESRLLVIDVQEKLLPAVAGAFPDVEFNCGRLLDAARIMGVPVSATEQYPSGLGETVSVLKTRLDDMHVCRREKVRFSAADAAAADLFAEDGRPPARQIVLCGIEAHVCVLQTAFDLLAAGLDVAIVADAVGSRSQRDYDFGLRRLRDAGAMLVSTESVIFEWLEQAGTPEFKAAVSLITAVNDRG